MAVFRVGQRVRIANPKTFKEFTGREGTIVRIPSWDDDSDCSVLVDGYDARAHGYREPSVAFAFSRLAPLTDPRADAFLESLKKLGTAPRIPQETLAYGE